MTQDHANAKRLASGLAELSGLSIDPARVQTNIVVVEVNSDLTAANFINQLANRGGKMLHLRSHSDSLGNP